MDAREILKHVDHTLLRPTATWPEILTLCVEALLYQTATVCVPPCYVERIASQPGDKPAICTVIGFPLGYDTTAAKVEAAKTAVAQGASEIDMVVNLADVKNGDFAAVTKEIAAVKEAIGRHILKVIVETCYLTQEEKIALCRCVTEGGADFIKTSTGFGTGGATLEDIRLFREHIGPGVQMKAAGGIRTLEDMEAYLREGCTRIGTSSAVKILTESLRQS
mgnify:FL=1